MCDAQTKLNAARTSCLQMTREKFTNLWKEAYPFDNLVDKEVCHIIASANGGADHPDNYVFGDTRINRANSNHNDAYYVGVVGEAQGERAVVISEYMGNGKGKFYEGPSAADLYNEQWDEIYGVVGRKKHKMKRRRPTRKTKGLRPRQKSDVSPRVTDLQETDPATEVDCYNEYSMGESADESDISPPQTVPIPRAPRPKTAVRGIGISAADKIGKCWRLRLHTSWFSSTAVIARHSKYELEEQLGQYFGKSPDTRGQIDLGGRFSSSKDAAQKAKECLELSSASGLLLTERGEKVKKGVMKELDIN